MKLCQIVNLDVPDVLVRHLIGRHVPRGHAPGVDQRHEAVDLPVSVRLCGHPVRVIFSYKDFRCNRRKQKLRSINGVNNRSKYHQKRFSSRLSCAINRALANECSEVYITEASGVPLSTIRHWRTDEIQLAKTKNMIKLAKTNFKSYSSFNVSLCTANIRNESHVFVKREYLDGNPLDKHILTEYKTSTWEEAVAELSDYLSSNTGTIPSSYKEMDLYSFVNLCFDYSSFVGIEDSQDFVYWLVNMIIRDISDYSDGSLLSDSNAIDKVQKQIASQLSKLDKLLPDDFRTPDDDIRRVDLPDSTIDRIRGLAHGDSIAPYIELGAKANKILQKDALSLDYADPETVARNFLYFHKYSLPVTTDKLGKRRLCLTKNGNIDYRKLTLKGFLLDE